jgi:hypothetical protein
MHLTMAFVLVEVTPSLLPAQSIVWTETDSSLIRRANSDGSQVQTIVQLAVNDHPQGIATDSTSQRIYWTNHQAVNFAVESVDPNGFNRTGLIADGQLGGAVSIAVDDQGIGPTGIPTMYFGQADTQFFGVIRSTIDGMGTERFIEGTGNDLYYRGIDLDRSGRRVYWSMCCADDSTPLGIYRAELDGSNVELLVKTTDLVDDRDRADDIVLDPARDRMYWVLWGLGIYSARLDGSDVEKVVSSHQFGGALAFDAAGETLYWSTLDSIWSSGLDGSNAIELISGTGRVGGIAFIPVPEPSSLVIVISTLFVTVFWRRRVHAKSRPFGA